jgi:hypothetical protein
MTIIFRIGNDLASNYSYQHVCSDPCKLLCVQVDFQNGKWHDTYMANHLVSHSMAVQWFPFIVIRRALLVSNRT